MSEKKILVPNIGDFKNVEVIEVLVKSGQQIKKNDPLITLEKATNQVSRFLQQMKERSIKL